MEGVISVGFGLWLDMLAPLGFNWELAACNYSPTVSMFFYAC